MDFQKEISTINFISTCTADDYKKYINDITTISSNFENIVVKQTNLEETKGILYNMLPIYEKFHNVKYERSIVEDIVKLSTRFIFDKSQPAASLDLLDECGSHIKNQISNTSEQIVQLQQKIDNIQEQKLTAVERFNFEDGIKLRRKETILSNKLKKEIIQQKAVEVRGG